MEKKPSEGPLCKALGGVGNLARSASCAVFCGGKGSGRKKEASRGSKTSHRAARRGSSKHRRRDGVRGKFHKDGCPHRSKRRQCKRTHRRRKESSMHKALRRSGFRRRTTRRSSGRRRSIMPSFRGLRKASRSIGGLVNRASCAVICGKPKPQASREPGWLARTSNCLGLSAKKGMKAIGKTIGGGKRRSRGNRRSRHRNRRGHRNRGRRSTGRRHRKSSGKATGIGTDEKPTGWVVIRDGKQSNKAAGPSKRRHNSGGHRKRKASKHGRSRRRRSSKRRKSGANKMKPSSTGSKNCILDGCPTSKCVRHHRQDYCKDRTS